MQLILKYGSTTLYSCFAGRALADQHITKLLFKRTLERKKDGHTLLVYKRRQANQSERKGGGHLDT